MVGRAEANQGNVEGKARDEVAAVYIRSIIARPNAEQETSCRAVHQAGEVVRHLLVGDRGAERVDDAIGLLVPAEPTAA